MKSDDQPLSPDDYRTFLGFNEDELFVARQLSLGHEIPKIETQLQVKTLRASEKKSARELFASICNKLDLHRRGSEKVMTRAVARSYKKFANMCRASARFAAKHGTQTSRQNATQRGGAGTSPQVPADIIGYYKLDLDVLAGRIDSLSERQKFTLMCLRTGDETGAQIGAKMGITPSAVSGNFNDSYKRLGIQHIKVRRHKRIIARLAYLRWAEKGDTDEKLHPRDSLDST